MKTSDIKKLAELVSNTEVVDEKTANYVLEKLTRDEQKKFLKYYKEFRMRQKLIVKSSVEIDNNSEKELLKHYNKKIFENIVDSSVGGGIVIQNDDNIIDLSIMGEINRFLKTIE